MLQKWSHHSQESEVINSLAFICLSMKFMVRNAEKFKIFQNDQIPSESC
jgi:hypothetical protein